MASAAEIEEIVLLPMIETFLPPKGMEISEERMQAIRRLFVKGLEPYDAKILRKAWDRVAQNHYGWEWPTLQQVVRECNLLVA